MGVKIRKATNISSMDVRLLLSNGGAITLPPKGVVENIDVSDISGVLKFLKVVYALND